MLNNTLVAIDGSKFKAVNNRDKNSTCAKMRRRLAEVDATEVDDDKGQMLEDKVIRLREEIKRYWTWACSSCAIKNQCTTGNERRVSRWLQHTSR